MFLFPSSSYNDITDNVLLKCKFCCVYLLYLSVVFICCVYLLCLSVDKVVVVVVAFRQGAFDALKYEMNQGEGGMSETAEQIASGSPPIQSNGQPLTLQQCHAIIKHLQQVNGNQSHEVRILSTCH